MLHLVSVDRNSMAVLLTRGGVKGFKKCFFVECSGWDWWWYVVEWQCRGWEC